MINGPVCCHLLESQLFVVPFHLVPLHSKYTTRPFFLHSIFSVLTSYCVTVTSSENVSIVGQPVASRERKFWDFKISVKSEVRNFE